MYYAAIDGELTAYHSSKKVVSNYVKKYSECHPESSCVLMRDVSGNNDTHKLDDGCELIQMKKIYLQRKYEDAYCIYGCGDTTSITHAIKLLESELIHERSYFNMLQILEVIRILKQYKYDTSHYIPSCTEMDGIVETVRDWQYSMYYN